MSEEVQWWEVALDPEQRRILGTGLVVFASMSSTGHMQPIGSGFVISANESQAVVLTAAHNLSGIHSLQRTEPVHHRSTLPEFLPPTPPLDVGRREVRVICFERDSIEVAVIDWAVYDEKADIAMVTIRTQSPASSFFRHAYQLSADVLKVGDQVGVLGRAFFINTEQQADGPHRSQKMGSRLFLRMGYVSELFPEGHLLCRGPCLQTTIPVFGGMSGGPIAVLSADGVPKAFGVVSSDAEGETDKFDPAVAGSMIVALPNMSATPLPDGKQKIRLHLEHGHYVRNTEFDPHELPSQPQQDIESKS